MQKARTECEYASLVHETWKALPASLGTEGARWKLLNVSPEAGSWTAAFFYPKGASVPAHVHVGPGEYFMVSGKLTVRGGNEEGGVTATAPCYGYEADGAVHDQTLFLEDTEVYMRFQGPLQFIGPDGQPVFLAGWEQMQALWQASPPLGS